MLIRDGCDEDLPRLLDIYNYYVDHTHITFDIERMSLEPGRAWFGKFGPRGPHRLFVIEEGGEVMGYASSGTFRIRPAYDRSVETSIYLAHEASSKGLGSALYERLLTTLGNEENVHRGYGGVAIPNEAYLALHQKFGFKRVGTFSEVGFKFGRYWDVAWFERAL